MNVRAARTFDIGLGDVQIMADVFNVTNGAAEQLSATGANQLFSPNYRLGRQLQLLRSVVVGYKFVF